MAESSLHVRTHVIRKETFPQGGRDARDPEGVCISRKKEDDLDQLLTNMCTYMIWPTLWSGRSKTSMVAS
jgi:hypothetical protein